MGFPPESFYLWAARWKGIPGMLGTFEVWTNMLCSAADILFIFCFLRMADLARKEECRSRIRIRWGILAVSLALTPILLFFKGMALMIWTSAILGIPYMVLAWSLFSEWKGIVRLVRRSLEKRKGRDTEKTANR